MNKTIKILIIIFVVPICLLSLIMILHHGWRLGFYFCDSPIEKHTGTAVKVTEDNVTLSIMLLPPHSSFKEDIIYKIDGNVLKVGVKQNDLIDIITGKTDGIENKVVPLPEGVVIDKVVLCGGGDERVIWTREEGNIN